MIEVVVVVVAARGGGGGCDGGVFARIKSHNQTLIISTQVAGTLQTRQTTGRSC